MYEFIDHVCFTHFTYNWIKWKNRQNSTKADESKMYQFQIDNDSRSYRMLENDIHHVIPDTQTLTEGAVVRGADDCACVFCESTKKPVGETEGGCGGRK